MGRGWNEEKQLKIVFKNVRKLRSMEKQLYVAKEVERNEVDICGVVETNLQDREFVEVGEKYVWLGVNGKDDRGRKGGVGFIVRKDVRTEMIVEEEDMIGIRVEGKCGRMLIVCVYQECEGTDRNGNEKRGDTLRKVVQESEGRGEICIVGGDFNGHIRELDNDENRNGMLMKRIAEETGMEILNCIWPGMDEWTWERGEIRYTLDYILVNGKALNRVEEAWVGDLQDIGESDHRSMGVIMRWRRTRKKNKREIRMRVRDEDLKEFGRRVDEVIREGKSVQGAMMMVCKEMKSEMPKGRKNRDWWDEEVEEAVKKRKERCRLHRRACRVGGDSCERTKLRWREYQQAKEEAKEMIAKKIHERNQIMIQSFGRGRERSQWSVLKWHS